MNNTPEKQTGWQRLVSWVDGDREPKDRTLFVMEQRPPRPAPDWEEHERRERHRLRKFLDRYPFAAIFICLTLMAVLLTTVLHMPAFGQAGNPTNNEVPKHYLEHGAAETGSANAVSAMILSYRGFDTLGESCVLFLSVVCVTMLLQRDEKNTDERDLRRLRREEALEQEHHDVILVQAAWILIPFIFLFAIYVLLHGEESPGGGFSGGTILSGGLILFASAFGFGRLGIFLNRRTYSGVRTFGLLLYALLYGAYIFIGANGLPNYLEGMALLIDLAVGLVVACTVYGFYALFARGEV
ncbi:MAG: hydrogen gas-evolving membrane-bound hydrogenase subunit E [Oscillibacter sp.]